MIRATGTFLALVGVCFFILFGELVTKGELKGDAKVSAFLIGAGVFLVAIGLMYLRSPRSQEPARSPLKVQNRLSEIRPAIKALAAIGCMLMFFRAISFAIKRSWPQGTLLWILLVLPIMIAIYALRISRFNGSEKDTGSQGDAVKPLSAWTRYVRLLYRVGWFGYFGLIANWPGVDSALPLNWRVPVEIVGSLFVSLLYASQIVLLHFALPD